MANDITHRDRATDLGVVRINNEAITTIASIAANTTAHTAHACRVAMTCPLA